MELIIFQRAWFGWLRMGHAVFSL
ncbi:hypothetical protein OIU79_028319 [Salix purpurea]|uniref:Uncharacterized protein n=1 Tax=Salix purpurea TaxID=77065 RepID=A0A9Q0VVS6_SALPP|nr:hypothetical protein OIU79_028319 [Salix purpurea]